MYTLSHKTDDELVQLYVGGCNEAFDQLLCRHKDKLFNYIVYQLRDQTDKADDVFQETFVKAIVTIKEGRYMMTGHFGSWLSRIAHNIIMDEFRMDAQLPIVDNNIGDAHLLNNSAIIDACMEDTLINEQTMNDIHVLMERLPAEQREVVKMRYYEDLSFRDIADKTGVSINTSLGRMRYALLNMRRMADEYGISLSII